VSVVANVAINIDAKNAAQVLEQIKGKVEQMNGTFKKVPEATKSIGDMQKAVAGLVAKFVSVAAVTATVKKGIDAAFDLGAAQQRIKNLTGSTEEYEVAVALANQAASDFGISQKRATEQFGEVIARVGGLGYGLKEVNEIYRGFDAIAVQSGATAEEAAGAFEQLVQALGRGKLQGEDFRSVAGRMPAVLDALAKSAGVSRGELQKMATDGKITSDIIFKALSEQAAGFDGLSKRLNEQQKAYNDLSTATEKVLTSIGRLFGPIIVAGAKALANAADEIGTFFNYLASVVFPESEKGVNNISGAAQELTNKTLTFGQAMKGVLQVATFVGTFVGLIKSVAIGIQLWTKATLILAGAKKALGAAMAFVLALTVKGLVVVAAAAAAAVLAADQVGKQIDAISAGMNDFTAQQKANEAASAGLVNNYSSMPEKIKDAKDEVTAFTGAAEESLSVVRQQAQALNAQVESLERGASVNAARYAAELAINKLKGEQLAREYEFAKTAQQRLNIAYAIFRQQAEAAQIEYKQALENIALEEKKAVLQVHAAGLKYDEIQAEGKLQILKAKNVDEEQKKRQQLEEALNAQMKVFDAAEEQVGVQKEISKFQEQTADAQFKSKILAAQNVFENKLVSKEIGISGDRARQLSDRLAASISPTRTLEGATRNVASNAQQSSYMFIEVAKSANEAANQIIRAADAQARLNSLRSQAATAPTTVSAPVQGAANGAFWTGGFSAFAKGGVVTKPTLGLIGEGGESEYIVPESKAAAFAANYLSGARGSNAIPRFAEGGYVGPINVQTGPVMQQDGQQYVSMGDLESAMQTVVNTILGNGRTPGGRRYSGVG
jgi:tape measure domain-containing protein